MLSPRGSWRSGSIVPRGRALLVVSNGQTPSMPRWLSGTRWYGEQPQLTAHLTGTSHNLWILFDPVPAGATRTGRCHDALTWLSFTPGSMHSTLAPVTRRVTDRQQNWHIATLGFLEGIRPPGPPFDRILCVLKQIGRGLASQAVHVGQPLTHDGHDHERTGLPTGLGQRTMSPPRGLTDEVGDLHHTTPRLCGVQHMVPHG